MTLEEYSIFLLLFISFTFVLTRVMANYETDDLTAYLLYF